MMLRRFFRASMTNGTLFPRTLRRTALKRAPSGRQGTSNDLTRLSARAVAAQLNPYELDGRQALQQLSQTDLDALRNRFSERSQPRLLAQHGELICLGGALGVTGLSFALVVLLELHLRQPLLTLLVPATLGVTTVLAFCVLQGVRVEAPGRVLNLLAPLSAYPSRYRAVLRDAQKSAAARAYLAEVNSRRELIVADDYAVFRQVIGLTDRCVRSSHPAR